MAKNTAEIESGSGVFGSIVAGLVTRVKQAGVDVGSVFHRLAKPEGEKLLDQIAELIILAERAAANIFRINVGGNRNTEEVVAAGNYSHANIWINRMNFPWRHRQGKRTIELVDPTEYGFSSTYSFDDVLAVLWKLDLARPVYEDGLLFGEQYPNKQRGRCSIMFPHEPVLGADGYPSVVCLWSNLNRRLLDLVRSSGRQYSDMLVAGVRES